MVSVNSSLGHPLTTLDKSLITSATALFALLVSPISGVIADSLGRKRVVLLADSAFVLGALIQAVSSSVVAMIAGRSIVGLAIGAGSFVAPLYIAELAPAPFRGRLVTLNVLFVTMGQVVAYIVGWVFVQWGNENIGWRWIVGLGAVPAAIQVFVMLFMPETPRWLVMVGRQDDARKVLNKVFGGGIDIQRMVDGVLKGIETEVREEEEAKRGRMRGQKRKEIHSWFSGTKDTWNELFRVGGNRRALTIACLLQGLQQLCGFVGHLSQFLRILLIERTEFPNVLLRHDFYNSWLREPDINISLSGLDEFCLHLYGSTSNRSRWEKTYPPLVNPYHGIWSSLLQCWVCFYHTAHRSHFRQSFLHRVSMGGSPIITTNSANDCSCQCHALRRSIRSWAGKCSLDAERAIPSKRSIYGFWTEYQYQLGSQLHCWVNISANDGISKPCMDLCHIFRSLRYRLDFDMADIPRNERLKFGRNRSIAC